MRIETFNSLYSFLFLTLYKLKEYEEISSGLACKEIYKYHVKFPKMSFLTENPREMGSA